MAKEKVKKEKHIKLRLIIFFLIVAILASTYFFVDKIEKFVNFAFNDNALPTTIEDSGLKVHFIDVDQAEAIFIEFPSGETMLIDSGDVSSSSQKKFVSYLDKLSYNEEDGEKVIDYFIITHPHDDHIGGALTIFENYKVKNCVRPNVKSQNKKDNSLSEKVYGDEATCDNETYNKIIHALANEVVSSGCTSITSDSHLKIKSKNFVSENLNNDANTWQLTFLSPNVDDLPYTKSGNYDYNNYSPIMILEYMNRKIMFTGDAEKPVEKNVIKLCEQNSMLSFLDVDILNAGHHGSKTSSSAEFLNYVKPEYVVISAGVKNQFNHPHTETINNLKNIGLSENDIYCTNKNGNVLVGVSKTGKMSLISDYVQYTTFKIEWWYLFSTGTVIAAIVIFAPLLSKKYRKIVKKHLKN